MYSGRVYENGSQHVTPDNMLNANPPRLFFASAFTEDEVNAASKYLVDAGLFEGPGTWQANGALVLCLLDCTRGSMRRGLRR